MASLDYTLDGEATGKNSYTLNMQVDDSVDMPTEIFLHEFSTRKFVKVADASELSFPTTPDAEFGFYRQATAEAVYGSLAEGNDAKDTNIPAAIQDLVNEFNADLTSFTTAVSATAS